MRHGQFLFVADVAERRAVRRVKEDGVVTETVRADRLRCDVTLDGTLCDVEELRLPVRTGRRLARRRLDERERTHESRRPRLRPVGEFPIKSRKLVGVSRARV